MAEVVAALVDHGELVQVQEVFAPNVVIGFACFEGRPVGIVANLMNFYAKRIATQRTDRK